MSGYIKILKSAKKIVEAVRRMTLPNFNWDYTVYKELNIDRKKVMENIASPPFAKTRIVQKAHYSVVNPEPVKDPEIVSISDKAMKSTLDVSKLDILYRKDKWTKILSGNEVPEGSCPIAHCYAGHQFGYFAGQLGDGRALTLGHVVNQKKERWELQLKGSGRTPYSRNFDGRAVLRSSIREFLVSEAMNGLGIPTSRAGSLITSNSTVERDPLYEGKSIYEK
jgi:serine/tyrosine/threonine adenylyltransferase